MFDVRKNFGNEVLQTRQLVPRWPTGTMHGLRSRADYVHERAYSSAPRAELRRGSQTKMGFPIRLSERRIAHRSDHAQRGTYSLAEAARPRFVFYRRTDRGRSRGVSDVWRPSR